MGLPSQGTRASRRTLGRDRSTGAKAARQGDADLHVVSFSEPARRFRLVSAATSPSQAKCYSSACSLCHFLNAAISSAVEPSLNSPERKRIGLRPSSTSCSAVFSLSSLYHRPIAPTSAKVQSPSLLPVGVMSSRCSLTFFSWVSSLIGCPSSLH